MTDMRQAVPERVDWVDVAKGVCIVMVVTMHAVAGVEYKTGETGWLHAVTAFAAPFRMPDFFLVAGLFLARRIDRPWPDYLDRKVLHFAYFYVLWVTIQFAFKAPGIAAADGAEAAAWHYLVAFVQPFGTLWFIYLLPIFFVAARLLRGVHPAVVLAVAAALEVWRPETGWVVADETAARFVYFYAGYALAPWIFALAARARAVPAALLAGLAAWALANGWLVHAGVAEQAGVSLALGAAGAMAIVVGSSLAARFAAAEPLRHCGENSIVIYLAFFLPMAATRKFLLDTGLVTDIGTVSLIVATAAVVGPLVLWRLVRGTRFDFLFVRPARARLRRAPAGRIVPAE